MKEVINFEELDKIIDSYKENRPQKRALLILKSDCEAYRGKGLPRKIAEKIVNERSASTRRLSVEFENEGEDDMAILMLEKAEKLDNVLHIIYE